MSRTRYIRFVFIYGELSVPAGLGEKIMALTINTNIFSVNAQRNLQKSENPLQVALQRLSTGYRINSAKDDAAGYAIASRQTLQIGGLGVAIRNANDGISFAQTAEGAMEEMITSLQRINELSLQAASNNTSTDRTSINREVTQLVAELNRIVNQTRYNGETFLDQAKSINVQVGTAVNELLNVSTSNVAPNTVGVSSTYVSTLTASDVAQAAISMYTSGGLADAATIEGTDVGGAITGSDFINNSVNVVNRVNLYSTQLGGVKAFSFGNSLIATNAAVVATTAQNTTLVDAGYLTVNGVQIGSFALASGATAVATGGAITALQNLASAINAKSANHGVTAVVSYVSAGDTPYLVLANTSGAAIDVKLDANVSNASFLTTNPFSSTTTTSVTANQNGKVILNAAYTKTSLSVNANITFRALGLGTYNAASTATTVSLTANSVNALDVTTAGGANVAILAVQNALDVLTGEKAKLGAVQNRLQTTVSNLDNVREQATAARSRIRDADFAEESANLSKALIIQQAGISVLSQANAITQNVLALLQR